jgi:DNA polymerase-3 subunit gamma/tau
VEHFRNILVARITGSTDLIETSGAYKNRYQKDAAAFSENDVLRLITIASNAESSLRWSQQPRLKFEVSVMQMVKMDSSVQIEQLLEDLESLKKKGNDNGSPAEQIAALTRDREPPVPVKTQKIQHAPVSFTPVGESSVLYPKAGNSPAMEVSPSQEAHLTRLSINEVMGKWSSFIDAARKDNIHVGTMLSETRPLSVQAERVSIGCPDDFHMDTLKRNRQFLTDLAHRVYGAKVILETMLAKESPSDPPREPPDAASATAPSVDGKLRQHPVVQALIKEFNAEIIP